MNYPQNISGGPVPQDKDGGQGPCRNAAPFVPPQDPAPDGAAVRPRPFRRLLADHIDRQFPLIQPA
jgi:hypothetical protein